MSLRCPDCGRSEPADARFCNACGTRLLAAVDEVTDAFDPVEEIPHEEDRGRFPVECGLFVVESGPKAGARYGLEAPITTIGQIGRAHV